MTVMPVVSALIGSSGFVGTTLLRQRTFDRLYNSANIHDIQGQEFDLVICAGAPAQKWIANKEPLADWLNLQKLIEHLKTVRCRRFVLISTIDVFKKPIEVDETSSVDGADLMPYGLHRRKLELFVERHFTDSLIVRLPGLVGPGLRKNVIFDFLNDNNLDAIDSRNVFQFYPTINLWYDLALALTKKWSLVHLTAEPMDVSEAAAQGFGKNFKRVLVGEPARYDMRSIYAEAFGGKAGYQYAKRESIQAIRSYAQSEPRVTRGSADGTRV